VYREKLKKRRGISIQILMNQSMMLQSCGVQSEEGQMNLARLTAVRIPPAGWG
jgi:hypothetical protein